MTVHPDRAVNLTQSIEHLPRPDGARRILRALDRGAGGPVFEVLARNGADAWPEEAGERDAIYIVIAGEGVLRQGGEALPCAVGDVIFAPAGVPRRFEALSRGFATWRVLLGPG